MNKRTIVILAGVILAAAIGVTMYYIGQFNKTTSPQPTGSTTPVVRKDIREIVWERLSSNQKESLKGDWHDARTSTIVMREGMVLSSPSTAAYTGKQVYMVAFPTSDSPTVGDLIVYVDKDTFMHIGYGLRD